MRKVVFFISLILAVNLGFGMELNHLNRETSLSVEGSTEEVSKEETTEHIPRHVTETTKEPRHEPETSVTENDLTTTTTQKDLIKDRREAQSEEKRADEEKRDNEEKRNSEEKRADEEKRNSEEKRAEEDKRDNEDKRETGTTQEIKEILEEETVDQTKVTVEQTTLEHYETETTTLEPREVVHTEHLPLVEVKCIFFSNTSVLSCFGEKVETIDCEIDPEFTGFEVLNTSIYHNVLFESMGVSLEKIEDKIVPEDLVFDLYPHDMERNEWFDSFIPVSETKNITWGLYHKSSEERFGMRVVEKVCFEKLALLFTSVSAHEITLVNPPYNKVHIVSKISFSELPSVKSGVVGENVVEPTTGFLFGAGIVRD